MRKNSKNEKVIRAMAIGISAMLKFVSRKINIFL